MKKIKIRIVNIAFNLEFFIAKILNCVLDVKSIQDTLEKIEIERCSVCRFGDGELKWIYNIKQESFQLQDKKLSQKLKDVISSEREDIIICVPEIFSRFDKFTDRANFFWKKHIIKYRKKWLSLLNQDKIYYNANITRPYMAYINKGDCLNIFNSWKRIFSNRDIIIVEGNHTRFGVGNDLLETAKSVRRIECPDNNAFSKYYEIKSNILKYSKNNSNILLLIALGPTATVLAYDISLYGIQAIDIGHLDIEYEWFLKGTLDKIQIANKNVNEATDKITLDENFYDDIYSSQIIKII